MALTEDSFEFSNLIAEVFERFEQPLTQQWSGSGKETASNFKLDICLKPDMIQSTEYFQRKTKG